MKGKRTAISAKICAQMLTVAGADHCVTMDLHTAEVEDDASSTPCHLPLSLAHGLFAPVVE